MEAPSPPQLFFLGGRGGDKIIERGKQVFFWKVEDVYKKVSNHKHEFRSSVMHGEGVKKNTPPPPQKKKVPHFN